MISSLDNPVLVRELQQAARLTRTPLILSVVTVVSGLLVCAIGGAASTREPAAEVGSVLFQAFFSLAFAVVAWVGPGVAALTIVSERSGRTWEPLVLTGLSPRVVAHGKLLASLSYVGLYLAALAPVGALPFLFGGVTATEVLLGYALLGIFAVLAVGFGLAVSSGAATPAMALLVTLPLAVAASMFTYFGLGVGLSALVHDEWHSVAEGLPVWLPSAYARVDFGFDYVAFLVVLPLAIAWLTAGLFREITVANLSDPSDDRSSGIKRWFVAAAAVLTAIGSVSPWRSSATDNWVLVVAAEAVLGLLSTFALFVLCSDPVGPSRRVRAVWARERASALRRFMGPGFVQTTVLLVAVTAASQFALVAGFEVLTHVRPLLIARLRGATVIFAVYATCFFVFLSGFATFARSLPPGRLTPRALLSLSLFVAVAGPLFAVAILGMATSGVDQSFFIAAPSPLYVFVVIQEMMSAKPGIPALVPGVVAMAGWCALGLFLGAAGARKLGQQSLAERAAWDALEVRIHAEDHIPDSAQTPRP